MHTTRKPRPTTDREAGRATVASAMASMAVAAMLATLVGALVLDAVAALGGVQ